MYERIINETRDYLIKEHGNPTVKKEGNMTFKAINPYLTGFDKLIGAFNRAIEYIGLNNIDTQMSLICEYAKDEEYINTEYIANKLNYLISRWEKGKDLKIKKNFIQLMQELDSLSQSKDLNISSLNNYLLYYLDCKCYNSNIDPNYNYSHKQSSIYFKKNSHEDNLNI